ncbi:MAG: tetratricopeptide repeat protein, partial [Cyanobacteria bacterium P01_F01_bin.143]
MSKRKLSIKTKLYKLRQRYSPIIISLLFIVSMTISPVIAQISTPSPVSQAQKSPRDLAAEAKELFNNEKFQDASQRWEQTANAFAESEEELNQAMALSNLSLTYQKLGQWQDAETAIQESINILDTAPANSPVLAQTLDIQGNLQRETGKTVEALDTWKEAANIYEELGKSVALEQNKLNQVQVMQDLGLYPRACKTLLGLLGTPFEDLTCPPLEWKITLKEKIKNQENKFSDKEQQIEKTLTSEQLEKKLQKIQENYISLATVEELRILGDVLRVLGQQELSKIVLHNSLNLAKKLDSHQNIDKVNTEGLIYLDMGKTAHSLTKEEVEPRRSIRVNNETQAIEFYEQAIKISPDLITRQQAELNLLSLLIQAEKWSKAKSLYEDIEPQFKLLTNSNESSFKQSEIFAQINYANIFINLLNPDKPQPPDKFSIPEIQELDSILANATQKAQKLGDIRAEAYALGNLGRLHELNSILNKSERELLTAKEYTTKALALVSSFNSPDITYQYLWQLGRIQKRQGNLEKAISAYTKAYNALESIRKDIININSSVQFSFRDNIEPIYRQLVALDLLYVETLEKAKNILKEEEIQEDIMKRLVQARNVIESLQIAQLNNFFLEPCVEGDPRQID